MGVSEWVVIGVFLVGVVLGVVGWLLIRVIGNLDNTIDKLNSNQEKQSDVLTSLQEKIIDNERRIYAIEIMHDFKGCVDKSESRRIG